MTARCENRPNLPDLDAAGLELVGLARKGEALSTSLV